ncbi:MAG: glycosyltransferase [Chloroflexia bacterium]|nr:glycosyltransferase [Chloroflexia bacterium]
MKLLLVIPYVPSLERPRSWNFIRRLSQKHEVSLITLVESAQEGARVQEIAPYCKVVKPIEIKKWQFYGNCLRYLPTLTPLRAASCFSPEGDRTIDALLRQERYDIVQVEQIRAAHFGARLEGVATVYDSTDSITLLLERAFKNSRRPLQKALFWEEMVKMRLYEPRISARFDRILMCSQEDADALLVSHPGLPISIVRNGVDLDYYVPQQLEPIPGRVVFTGRLSYYVNSDSVRFFLDEVFPRVLQKRPDATLDIVGSGPSQELLAEASERVRVTGFVPDLRPYIAQASVSICPVRLAVGTQNKIIEAMAMGTPVVASVPGSTGLAVEDGKELMMAADAAEFADRVVEVLDNPSLAHELARNGRAYVQEHHHWDRIVGQLEGIYCELV